MVLTILAALGGVAMAVGSVLDGVHLWRNGGTGTGAVIDPSKLDDAQKKALEEANKAVEEAKKNAEDAAKIDKTDEGNKKVDEGNKKIDEGNKKIDEGNKKVEEGTKKIDEGTKKVVDDTPAPTGEFAIYKAHRTELERRLEENPLLIKDGSRTQLSRFGQAYMQLLKNEKDVRQDARGELAAKKRGKPDYSSLPDQKVVDRYVEAALYQKTAKEAETVYNLLPKE